MDVGSKIRLACAMGHDRWVPLRVSAPARAIGKHEVSNRTYPPRDCLRCGFPIIPRLALNQKRHGRCATLEIVERRRAKARAVRPRATRVTTTPTPKRRRVLRRYKVQGAAFARAARCRTRAASTLQPETPCEPTATS